MRTGPSGTIASKTVRAALRRVPLISSASVIRSWIGVSHPASVTIPAKISRIVGSKALKWLWAVLVIPDPVLAQSNDASVNRLGEPVMVELQNAHADG